jgi:thiol-disulfide isomerase/thioredoxin
MIMAPALLTTWLGFYTPAYAADVSLPIEGSMPSFDGGVQWLNSPPLTKESLRGKVVVVDFWTYSCINCLNALPSVKAWAKKYHDQGVVVIGVHTPEFAYEKDPVNVCKALTDLGVTYPVVTDNNYAIWRAYNNQYWPAQYWPAQYFIDAQGRIRHHHYGEGEYQESDQVIQQLIREAHSGASAHP